MNQDYVTQLRLQLREAALREERRTPAAQRFARARRGLPGPRPLAAALAVALLALAAAIGVLQLRGKPEPVKPKVTHTFKVAESLLSLSSGFGAAWASDPIKGEVLRIDPKTRRVTARVRLGGEVQAAAGAGAVWALTGDLLTAGASGPVTLVRIDPETNRVVARIPARSPQGDNFAPLAVRTEGNHVWVLGAQGALRVDPARNTADRFVAFEESRARPAAPAGVPSSAFAEGERVWILLADRRLREYDARTGRAVRELPPRAGADAPACNGAGALLLAGATTLTLADHASGRSLWRTPLGGAARACLVDGDHVWVAAAGGPESDMLVRLDADSGRRTGRIALPAADAVELARVGEDVWIGTAGGTIVVAR